MSRIALSTICAVIVLCGTVTAFELQRAPGGSGRWPQYQAGPSHNAVLPGNLRAEWLRQVGGKINGGLALADGSLYVVSFDQKLYSLDPSTGDVKWSAGAANILMSTPVVADGVVVVGSGKDGFLKPKDASSQVWGRPEGDDVLAFTTDGKKLWSLHTAGDDMPSPAIDGSTVYFANGDAHAYARDLHTGNERWTVALDGIPTMASATLHDGNMFTSICHNAPYYCETIALDESNGKRLWKNPNGGSDCTPTVDGGRVFVESSSVNAEPYHTGGRVSVAALDERTGHSLWVKTYPAAPFTYIASSERQIAGTSVDGVLYQAIANIDRIVALDEKTGKQIWSTVTAGNVKMSPVVKGDRVYFGDTEGVFYAVDRSSGRIVRTVSYLQSFSVSPPVVYGDTLFIASGNIVVAMRLDTI